MNRRALAELMREAGLQPAWERTPEATRLPQRRPPINQPAWQRQPEAQPGFQRETPAQALENPYTVSFQRRRSVQEIQQEQQLQQLAASNSLGGMAGYADGERQVEEFGRGALDMTGVPNWARGIRDLQYGRPGEAIPEFLMGALNTGGLATLPYGAGGRPPPRMGMRLPQAMPEPMPPARVSMQAPASAADLGATGGRRRLYSGRTGERASQWATPDRLAANDYAMDRSPGAASGAVDFVDRDVSGALTVRSGDDIAAALPDSEQHLLDRFDDMAMDEMPWEILENPAIQAALRRNGVSVVHLPRDVSPNSIRHESYLFLDELPAPNASNGSPPQAMPEPTPSMNPPARLAPDGGAAGGGQRARSGVVDIIVKHRLGRPQIALSRNPTEGMLARMARPGDELRWVRDADGNEYVAPAMEITHAEMLAGLRDRGVAPAVADANAGGMIRRTADGNWQIKGSEGEGDREWLPLNTRRSFLESLYTDAPNASNGILPNRPPARLPGRATDGSVLPVRQQEPFRNSMRGGSDDLFGAARMSPDEVVSAREGAAEATRVAGWARRLEAGEYPTTIAREVGLPPWQIREAVERLRGRGSPDGRLGILPPDGIPGASADDMLRNAPNGGAAGVGQASRELVLPQAVQQVGRDRGPTGLARYRYAPPEAPRGTTWDFVVEPDANSAQGLSSVQMQLRVNGQPVPIESALGHASPEEAFAIYRALQETLAADAIANQRPGYYITGAGRLRDLHERYAQRLSDQGMLPPGYRYIPREGRMSARIVRDQPALAQSPNGGVAAPSSQHKPPPRPRPPPRRPPQ